MIATIFGRQINLFQPLLHAAAFVVLGSVAMLVYFLIARAGGNTPDATVFWLISGALLLLFALLNCATSIGSDKLILHVQKAFLAYGLAMVGLGGAAWLFSGVSIFEAESFRSIYMMLLVAQMTLLAIALFIRSVFAWLIDDEGGPKGKYQNRK